MSIWRKNEADGEISDVPKDVEYVNALLVQMYSSGAPSIELRRSEPIAVLPGLGYAPDFSSVSNRLKIMCNLNPICYQQPVEGKVRLQFPDAFCVLRCRFEDVSADPFCELFLEREA
jgi:hypothetical protein